ncbi:MAG: ATP-dependent protease subunit HslV [Candidatus Eisenbacteria bacterium]|nr:ATP-dependent protease subunit HslV [Candidatus Latescibacterota bacterium]MBD3301826.1 ATP-dependent protease subunit HslV [Candidatus Eisenbacteria bacterium]
MQRIRATTVLGLIRDGRAAIAADGQVTAGGTILKSTARKIRRLSGGKVLAGFAGGAADALQLFERFEKSLQGHGGNLRRAAVEVARFWRTDRALRRLDAQLLVLDREQLFVLSGNGDLVEPDEWVLAVGSGAGYAIGIARALLRHTDLPVDRIAREALHGAAEICIYTGGEIQILQLPEDS